MSPPVVAAGGELGGRAEDEVFAVGREGLGDVAGGFGAGPGVQRAGHALDEFAAGQVNGDAGGAVGETGRADAGAAEGEGVEARVGAEGVEEKGAAEKGLSAGMPTYSVDQPSSPRVAT